jgi:hypothetical protein
MQRILMHDAEIRQLSQPWLRRMAGWMPNSGPSGSSLSGNLW